MLKILFFLGDVKLCSKEAEVIVAAKKEKKEKVAKEAKPKDTKPKVVEAKREEKKESVKPPPAEEDESLLLGEKKKDPLDLLPKGTFDLEEWKRFYSNNDEAASCAWFWQHFDSEHYSIWRGDYRYRCQRLMLR
jgi:elongation factor 1-gamma